MIIFGYGVLYFFIYFFLKDGPERWRSWEELVTLLCMFLHSYTKTMKGEALVNDGVKPTLGSALPPFGMCWQEFCPYPS